MLKLILMSILFATIVIPYRSARAGTLEEGLKRGMRHMFGFVVLWALACIWAYNYLGWR